MLSTRIFQASSSELKEDWREFELFIDRKNKDWVSKGVFLDLVIWEDFLDAMSNTGCKTSTRRPFARAISS
jgi:hypothetical protein